MLLCNFIESRTNPLKLSASLNWGRAHCHLIHGLWINTSHNPTSKNPNYPFEWNSILLCRKVTVLVVGLDKAGKTSSIRGMLRGNSTATRKLIYHLKCSNKEQQQMIYLCFTYCPFQCPMVWKQDPPKAASEMSWEWRTTWSPCWMWEGRQSREEPGGSSTERPMGSSSWWTPVTGRG